MKSCEYPVHAKVLGAAHARKGTGCEDAAGSVQLPNTKGLAFAVADGHGDVACSRSALGSRIAVDVALDCLARFSESVGTELPEAAELIELGSRVVHTWRAYVLSHYEKYPLTEGELGQLGERGMRIAERRPEHLYGTTLLAGLLLPQVLVLLQQGDGCCVVIDARGNAVCPMPEDERCVGNMTTSMCDVDAAEHIRSFALECADGRPAACFVGTDGVDKSLMGEDGLIDYCVELALELVDMQPGEQANRHIEEQLSMLSEQGAEDDTSLAGFLNPSSIRDLAPVLNGRLQESYRLAQIDLLNEKLNSMERLHNKYLSIVPEDEEERERRNRFLSEYDELERQLCDLGGSVPRNDAEVPREATGEVVHKVADDSFIEDTFPNQLVTSGPAPAQRMEAEPDPAPVPPGVDESLEATVPQAPLRAKTRRKRKTRPSPEVGRKEARFSRRDIILIVSVALSVVSLVLVVIMLFFVLSVGGEDQPIVEKYGQDSQGTQTSAVTEQGDDANSQPTDAPSTESAAANPRPTDAASTQSAAANPQPTDTVSSESASNAAQTESHGRKVGHVL